MGARAKNLIKKIKNSLKYITDKKVSPQISRTREAENGRNREKITSKFKESEQEPEKDIVENLIGKFTGKVICPYCTSEKYLVKRGKRKKKYETVQLYYCKKCQRTFTPQIFKGKHYPLRVILEGISLYNLGHTLEETCRQLKEKFGIKVQSSTLNNWIEEFKNLCTYSRIRRFGKKLYSPSQIAPGISLYHRQIYKFRIHRGKLVILLQEDPRHHRLWPLQEFLEATFAECPHHLFKEGERASEVKVKFNLHKVIIREKYNFANRIARLVLQAVEENKKRHEELQKFFLYNDSVTVACEVPVYLLPEDIEHMESQLDFEIPLKIEKVLTGHIDLIQLRNGLVHILDYKPNAAKERPIEQLTLYALAMSRLTGLRLYDFKCAWFDENHYFEFYPLHVVYKLKERQVRVSKNQAQLIE
ncbi:PD-(D/E)XK nuclease family protein [bacterium]|nr:PD-(D/E)XK nuclease family protein [bacterium]